MNRILGALPTFAAVALITMFFLAPMVAFAGYEHTKPLLTVTDCKGNPIEGVTQSTDETYAIQKAVALGPGEWCIERPDIRVVVDGEKPDPEPDPEPEPGLEMEPDPEPTPPTGIMVCPPVDHPTATRVNRYRWYSCNLAVANEPFYSPWGVDFPAGYIVGLNPGPKPIKISMHRFTGEGTTPVTHLSGYSTSDRDVIQINVSEDGVGPGPNSHWIQSGPGVLNYNGRKMAAAIDYVVAREPEADPGAGIHLVGTSLGGRGSMHQPMIFPEPYRSQITLVAASIGHMMIPLTEPEFLPDGYTQDDLDAIDIRVQWEKVTDVHFAWRGAENDGLGKYSPEFWGVCEQHKLSCSGYWHQGGHKNTESGYDFGGFPFDDPNQGVDLRKPLPVITNNSSNHHGGERGWHNRGVTWDIAGITESASVVVVPLTYTARTSPGPGLPDMGQSVTFDVTLRRVSEFDTCGNVNWSFGAQSGVVMSDGCLLTIRDLALQNNETQQLILTRGDVVVVPPPVVNPPEGSQVAIVYTRVPRTLPDADFQHNDLYDRVPEAGHIDHSFTGPGQLVLREADGSERIIYDCVTDDLPCVPFDAAVSLDGKKIAFAVYRSDAFETKKGRPNRYLSKSGRSGEIHIYDIATDTLTDWPHREGDTDISPAWLPDGKIMFGSDRHGEYQPAIPGQSGYRVFPRLYIAEEDGSNAVDVSPHEVTSALHPYTLANGRVAYSSLWWSHGLPFEKTNGGVSWFGTLPNFWNVVDSDYRGGDMTALLGAHNSRVPKGQSNETLKALHFLGQRDNGDICVTNYYRGNNLGQGDVVCFTPEPKLLEGPAPDFIPRNTYTVGNYSVSNDNATKDDTKVKMGFPEGYPGGGLLLTVGQGLCSTVAFNPERAEGRKGCDLGLYRLDTIPSESISDLIPVVDSPAWHEYGARVVRPREVDLPPLDNTDDGSCVLASSDAGSTDAHAYKGYRFNGMMGAMANNGGEIHGLDHDELAAIRYYEVVPNGSTRPSNITGNDLRFMGDVPLLSDSSFAVSLPCETPFLMAGVDSAGRITKRDQIPMALRPGEKRICTGCHLHGSEGRPYEESLAYSADPYPLLSSTPVATWSDVKPIIDSHCVSCHADTATYELVAYDPHQKRRAEVIGEENLFINNPEATGWNRRYGFQRPMVSFWVNSMFARESPLYWGCMGSRQDGRTNDQYEGDIDFPESHPALAVPASQCKTLAGWIDSGLQE